LRSGDLILDVNGRPVASASDLTRRVALAHPGEDVHLKVRRDGVVRDVAVRSAVRPSEAVLAGRTDEPSDAAFSRLLGLRLAPNPGGGVIVKGVVSGSDAEGEGVSQGDIILRADFQRTDSPEEFRAAVEEARQAHREFISLLIDRGGRKQFVAVNLGANRG
jgi:serine protease Do